MLDYECKKFQVSIYLFVLFPGGGGVGGGGGKNIIHRRSEDRVHAY